MENILLVINGIELDMNSVDFACYIANLMKSRITAVFIENIKGEEKPVLKQLYGLPYVESITAADLPENKETIKSLELNKQLFGEACARRGVKYQIHRGRKANAMNIITESRFADLVIINPGTSFEDRNEGLPSQFAKEILENAECPVIIAPYSFNGVDEILLTYDGAKSSVFAIKQFAHLLPELKNKRITILQIDEKQTEEVSNSDELRELLTSHFSHIDFQHLKGKPADQLFAYLLGKKNLFVVMGAYGRGLLSSMFKHSTADLLIKTINLPIFTAHKK